MSRYAFRATIACPEAMIDDCNQMSGCWGLSLADASYFDEPTHQDADGNLYCVRSTACTGGLLQNANSGVIDYPAWDTSRALNLDAARRAASVLVVNGTPSPAAICAVIGDDAAAAIVSMGLIPIASEDDQ